jgi:hypothetical protein
MFYRDSFSVFLFSHSNNIQFLFRAVFIRPKLSGLFN